MIEILLNQQTVGLINLSFLSICPYFIFISLCTHAICSQQHMLQTKTFLNSTRGSEKLSAGFFKQDGFCQYRLSNMHGKITIQEIRLWKNKRKPLEGSAVGLK